MKGNLYKRTLYVKQAAKRIHFLLAVNFLVNIGDIVGTITANFYKAKIDAKT